MSADPSPPAICPHCGRGYWHPSDPLDDVCPECHRDRTRHPDVRLAMGTLKQTIRDQRWKSEAQRAELTTRANGMITGMITAITIAWIGFVIWLGRYPHHGFKTYATDYLRNFSICFLPAILHRCCLLRNEQAIPPKRPLPWTEFLALTGGAALFLTVSMHLHHAPPGDEDYDPPVHAQ